MNIELNKDQELKFRAAIRTLLIMGSGIIGVLLFGFTMVYKPIIIAILIIVCVVCLISYSIWSEIYDDMKYKDR